MRNFYNRLFFNQILPALRVIARQWQPPCLLCGERIRTHDSPSLPHRQLCEACMHELPWLPPAACPRCALPSPAGQVCGQCLTSPPAFDSIKAVFCYRFPIDNLIARFKYHQDLAVGAMLSACLPRPPAHVLPHLILPMPIHTRRLQQRGFHHALFLAQPLATQWQLPLVLHGCQRVRDTDTQAGMTRAQRLRNLRGAFSCSQDWQGQHVLVVDDVMTTGASMHALAKTLKQAGAARVSGLVLARTLP